MKHRKLIVAISGSLRRESINTAVLRAVAANAPNDVRVELLNISELPFFNEDLQVNPPAAVVRLRERVQHAAGLLLSSPEYNHGCSAALKNALDWLSYPYGRSPLRGKKVLTMTSSTAFTGGVRSHAQINSALDAVGAARVAHPQIVIPNAHTKMRDGEFKDRRTLDFILEGLAQITW
ncbi:NADPH-dependent FMN reductase [Pseudomonas japonica]|uniref:NADPH-dependent FMN reductase n=1 Tax=Pseudomonas japonica TaxID=256466 RepID=UPI003A85AE58